MANRGRTRRRGKTASSDAAPAARRVASSGAESGRPKPSTRARRVAAPSSSGAPTAAALDIDLIVAGEHGQPFAVLGPQVVKTRGTATPAAIAIRVFVPNARKVAVRAGRRRTPMQRLHPAGFFEAVFPGVDAPFDYTLAVTERDGRTHPEFDPYAFPPVLGDLDLHLFQEGTHHQLWTRLGAQVTTHAGRRGVAFAVWAPNAKRVSVIGSFNRWDERAHPMRRRGSSGIWELFIPGVGAG